MGSQGGVYGDGGVGLNRTIVGKRGQSDISDRLSSTTITKQAPCRIAEREAKALRRGPLRLNANSFETVDCATAVVVRAAARPVQPDRNEEDCYHAEDVHE